jgi:enterochelin esterase-like enzyme
MKPTLLLAGLLISCSSIAQSIVKESLKLKSTILGKDVEYSIYLPPDYATSERRYPVLYLLHGFTDDETAWTQFGEVKAIADAQLQKMEMTPMIIVMPDAGTSWYMNSADGKVKFDDFFIKEFIPFIDATYKTRTQRQFRALAGLSMGGLGTLIYAFKYPDLFSAAAPLSAAVLLDEEVINTPADRWAGAYGIPIGKDLAGAARLTEHYKSYSPLYLVKNGLADELKKVQYYIDCGDKDFLIKGNMALHAALIDKQIPHEFRVREGVHNWTYWRTALPDVFRFISTSFHR